MTLIAIGTTFFFIVLVNASLRFVFVYVYFVTLYYFLLHLCFISLGSSCKAFKGNVVHFCFFFSFDLVPQTFYFIFYMVVLRVQHSWDANIYDVILLHSNVCVKTTNYFYKHNLVLDLNKLYQLKNGSV